MIARKVLGKVRSVTTDNGCEFLDPGKIKTVVGCNIYHTRAYASREKGSVENCNRFVRRWYPKGTDFGKCTRADMHRLERVINSIHRRLLGGKTAYEYDTAFANAAQADNSNENVRTAAETPWKHLQKIDSLDLQFIGKFASLFSLQPAT